jgi:hypothetical protein
VSLRVACFSWMTCNMGVGRTWPLATGYSRRFTVWHGLHVQGWCWEWKTPG